MIKRSITTFLASLLFMSGASILLVSNLAAQSLLLTGAGSADSLLPNQIIFQASQACTPSSNICTISSANFGVAQANRYIVFTVSTITGCTSSSATIGGVSATQLKQVTTGSGGAIYGANVPSGTTGNIVWTCGINPGSTVYVGYWTIYGLNSLTPDSNCQASNGSSCSLATTVNGGYMITYTTYNSNGSSTLSGTGAVQDFDADYSTGHSSGGNAPLTGSAYSSSFSRASTSIQAAVALH